jgi:transposase
LAECKVRRLEERLRLLRINKYGPASERLSDAQLELLELEPGVSAAEVVAEGQREPLSAPRPAKPARPHPGRQQLPPELPRVERLIACTPEQCVCGQCGRPTTVIGYEQSEQLDVEPAKYVVVVTKREKRACKVCEEQGVQCAPLPARIIEKGLASDRVVIDTVVRKYSDHLPLFRQSVILEREAGLVISRATLDGSRHASGRVAAAPRRGDAAGIVGRLLPASRRNAGGGANARRPGPKSSGLLVAVWSATRLGGVRLSAGPGPRRAETLLGQLCRPAAKRRLRGLRSGGW